ncbi:MAG: type 1 glutamine amidotransferase [Pseudomonadota bacterium]
MRILILQNDAFAPAGLVGDRLVADGADTVVLRADDGDRVPNDVGDYDALVALGGVQSAADFETWPYLAEEAALMRQFAEADRPTLGICLGAQIMARAHGAAVRKLDEMEIGFSPLSTTKQAADDPLFGGGDPWPQMQWHGDTFDLPETAVLLSTNEICRNQAMRIGRAQYAVQFHFEVTREIVVDWIAHSGIKLEYENPGLIARLRSELDQFSDRAAVYGRQLVDRWVSLIKA